jgi:hypothetical protein
LAPPMNSQPLPRWAQWSLSISCRPVTPTYKLQVKTSSRTCIHALPRALWLWASPTCQSGLRRFHVSYSFGSHLPTEVASSTATCPMALDLTSQLRWAPALTRGSGPHFLTEVGSDTTMCSLALDLTSRMRWPPTLSHVPRPPMGHGPQV